MSFILVGAGVGALTSIVGGIIGSQAAKKQAAAASRAARAQEMEINRLKASRQEVTNPYANTTDLSGLATDTSKMLSNPYANLGVATQAAEIQMEQTDMALANTLDTIRSTGASAGGATALAQAALQSKKGVAANIEQQEVANEKMKAQGEQQLQTQKQAEQQRLQSIAISEGQRNQAADAAGQQFMFQAEEARTNMDLNRAAGLQDRALSTQAQANQAGAAAVSGAIQGVGSAIGGAVSAYGQVTASENNLESSQNNLAAANMNMLIGSDRRLKKNIKKIKKSLSGLNIYSFEYIDESYGKGVYEGVMSDEIPTQAVTNVDGYDRVDYSKIDVEFKKI
jgi:hypothetical protein